MILGQPVSQGHTRNHVDMVAYGGRYDTSGVTTVTRGDDNTSCRIVETINLTNYILAQMLLQKDRI